MEEIKIHNTKIHNTQSRILIGYTSTAEFSRLDRSPFFWTAYTPFHVKKKSLSLRCNRRLFGGALEIFPFILPCPYLPQGPRT